MTVFFRWAKMWPTHTAPWVFAEMFLLECIIWNVPPCWVNSLHQYVLLAAVGWLKELPSHWSPRSKVTAWNQRSFTRCHISAEPPPACLWFFGRRRSAAAGNAASGPWSRARGSGGSAGSPPAWRRRWCCSGCRCLLPAPGPSCLPPHASGSPSPSSGLLLGTRE